MLKRITEVSDALVEDATIEPIDRPILIDTSERYTSAKNPMSALLADKVSDANMILEDMSKARPTLDNTVPSTLTIERLGAVLNEVFDIYGEVLAEEEKDLFEEALGPMIPGSKFPGSIYIVPAHVLLCA